MMVNKKCPAGCVNGRIGGTDVKCSTCRGLGFVSEEVPVTTGPVPAPSAANPKWFQIVLAILATVAAIASAYTAAQSNKNSGTLDTVHEVQNQNAQRLKDIHKEVVPAARQQP